MFGTEWGKTNHGEAGQKGKWRGLSSVERMVGLTVTPVPPTGTHNYNGQSVFSIVPVEGLMFPGKAQEFTVTFSPDHESLYFSDLLQVVLFEKVGLRAGPPEILPHPGRDSFGWVPP